MPTAPVGALALILLCFSIVEAARVSSRDARIEKLHAEGAALTTERDGLRTDISSAQSMLSDAQTKLKAANAEIALLKETAQYKYQQAIKLAEPNTDAGDQAAVDALQDVIDRYPTDPYAQAAKDKGKEFQGRIAKRAADLRAAQAQVRNLIATCRSSSATARGVTGRYLRFDMFQQVDMNSLMAGSQQQEVYEKQAKAAKEKATELVKSVPDPDGKLAEAVDKCDGAD